MKISVVVTTYNHEDYIAECLDSIIMQQGDFSLEIIIGDDASTDSTRRILEDYRKKYPFILVLMPETANLGVTKNIKRCLDACSGDYIAFCEGDDYWTEKHKLRHQLEFLESHPEYALCFNAIFIYYEDDDKFEPFARHLFLKKKTLTTKDLIKENSIGNFSCCMYRSGIVRQLPDNLFDIYTVDWMFNIACSRLGKVGFIREWMSVYRKHTKAAWSGKSVTDQCQDMLGLIDIYNQYYHFEYDRQFKQQKENVIRSELEEQIKKNKKTEDIKVPFFKKYRRLLITAIKNPWKAIKKIPAVIVEIITDIRVLARTNTLVVMPELPGREVELLVLDTVFPHPLSPFRLQEFRCYLDHFKSSVV